MDNWSGRNIKGYELNERIGTGGFGAVYKANQSTVGREVAIKIILPHFANHPDFIRRFEAEAQLVARLEHMHIVPLYDYWRDPDGAYLVMRWLRGGSLQQAIQDRPFDLQASGLILDQITTALAVAHRHMIVHRDLKPGNILLDEDGNAYLADFGIAKNLSSQGTTQADAIVGSPDYLAPEQANGEKVTPRTDIYSLGVVLYELLTGQHPFPNLNAVERLYKHLSEPLPEITTLSDNVRDSVNAIIQKATAKNPAHRYPDALAFAAAFREAVQIHPTESLVETLTQREQDILSRIIAGYSNRQIAEELVVTIGTVKWYVNQIFQKLNVRSRVQAIVRARELHLIVPAGSGSKLTQSYIIPTEDFRPENPYKGLRAFQSADNQDFFGREKLVQKLISRLTEAGESTRFLAIVGPSGSGKSSLVKAGLIPAIWRGELSGSEKWFVAEMLPGAHPLDELEIALMRVATRQNANIQEQLMRDERGLLRASQLILPDDDSQLVLIIDQFEEVFTLVENEASRQHFLSILQTAIREPRSRIRVIITLRADFYDRPLHYEQFGDLLRGRMETILPLGAEGLEQAITKPAERVGASFEPGLVTAIVEDVNYQPGALPLLQYALTELFEHRQGRLLTHEAYRSIGGTAGALAKRAEQIYNELSIEAQEAACQMFLRLVTLGEGKDDTRRRVQRNELLALVSNGEMMEEIIDNFAFYRLLSLDNDPSTRSPTVEVAHEAIMKEWERLNKWIQDSREDIKMQQQLAHLTHEWLNAKSDASYLVSGLRLEQFEKWVKDSQLALTADEQAYLATSVSHREQINKDESIRKQHEVKLEKRSELFLRGLVAVLLLATLGAFGLTAVAANQSQIAQNNLVMAIAAQATTERSFKETQSVALAGGAQDALRNNQPDVALALALEANMVSPAPIEAQRALADSIDSSWIIRRFQGNTAPVLAVAFSPDGRQIVSASPSEMLILWDAATGNVIRKFGTRGQTSTVLSLAFSPDGQTILTGAYDGRLVLWNTASGEVIHTFTGQIGQINSVAFSPDGKRIVVGKESGKVVVGDIESGSIISEFIGHKEPVHGVAFSPDSKTVLSASWDKSVILWDVATGNIIRKFEGHSDRVTDITFSPDGKTALSASSDHTLILWNVTTGELIRRFEGHTEIVDKVTFSPNGKEALSGSEDNTLILWDLATGNILRRYTGHTGPALGVMFSPDGNTAVSGSADTSLILWDIKSEDRVHQFRTHKDEVWDIAFSPDGKTLLSAAADYSIILWDITTSSIIRRFIGHTTGVLSIAFSPDGKTAVSVANGGPDDANIMLLWDIATGKIIRHFYGNTDTIYSVAFSSDGTKILSGGADKILRLWDTKTGNLIERFFGHTSTIYSVIFSPDGRTLLSGSADNSLILWDVETNKMLRRFEGHSGSIWSVAFSPDGRTILSGSQDSTLVLWDVSTGVIIRRFKGHTNAVRSVAFSPDGNTAISGSQDDSLILWDVATANIIHRYLGHTNDVYSVVFNYAGSLVASASADSTVYLWRANNYPQNLFDWVHNNRFVPQITCEQRETYRLEPTCQADGTLAGT